MEKKKKDRGGGENDLMILSWISNSRSEWKGKKKQASIEEKEGMIYLSKHGSIKDLYQQI